MGRALYDYRIVYFFTVVPHLEPLYYPIPVITLTVASSFELLKMIRIAPKHDTHREKRKSKKSNQQQTPFACKKKA